MRIFCCSNLCEPHAGVGHRVCFNPPCGFFVVRTASTTSARWADYAVSIRHADFLLFEPCSAARSCRRGGRFQSAMRIFCCSNALVLDLAPGLAEFQSAMRIFCCSNAPRRLRWRDGDDVSIRHADFLLFERIVTAVLRARQARFQSAMRIFCCSNHARRDRRDICVAVSIRHADFLLFELRIAVRIFRHATVSIRHADFLLFERVA